MLVALFYAGAVLGMGALPLAAVIGRQASSSVQSRVGAVGVVWFAFVLGQGILGSAWLVISLAGVFYPWLVVTVLSLGWMLIFGTAFCFRERVSRAVREIQDGLLSFLHGQTWYLWIATGLVILALLRGLISLLPPEVDDALHWYLVPPKVIATSYRLEFQPFVSPNNGLYPLQVEMHWAALFSVSNETAVTVWDYLCALSFLLGVGLLAWSLTGISQVSLVAILMILSTPGFYAMTGGGRPDNAAAQYGVAAFLWLILLPELKRRCLLMTGLCVGWAMAARYTNVILLPALITLAGVINARGEVFQSTKSSWINNTLLAGIATTLAVAPMLMKNWLLVGCPFAPVFGCQDAFWLGSANFDRQNISATDLFLYPFVWTFGRREDMLGNISPLFVGFLPFLLIYHSLPSVRLALLAGLAGLITMFTWLIIKPMLLYTRWLLIPLGLFAVPLSASGVAVEADRHRGFAACWMVRSTIVIVLFFLLFESRGVVYAFRYAASIDSRASRYQAMPGYDVADWLNSYVERGHRVALAGWSGYPYFLDSQHLVNSESAEELQWFWENYGSLFFLSQTANFWRSYVRNGFSYVVLAKDSANNALADWPSDLGKKPPRVVFKGRSDVVLKIERNSEAVS
jgi:hypothetical protein